MLFSKMDKALLDLVPSPSTSIPSTRTCTEKPAALGAFPLAGSFNQNAPPPSLPVDSYPSFQKFTLSNLS